MHGAQVLVPCACVQVSIRAGFTVLIPPGWIHSVLTPVDTIAVSGSFLPFKAIPMSLRARRCEHIVGAQRETCGASRLLVGPDCCVFVPGPNLLVVADAHVSERLPYLPQVYWYLGSRLMEDNFVPKEYALRYSRTVPSLLMSVSACVTCACSAVEASAFLALTATLRRWVVRSFPRFVVVVVGPLLGSSLP
jgi:hypothetical protein